MPEVLKSDQPVPDVWAVRPADAMDVMGLAPLVIEAGGGVHDFLMRDLVPGLAVTEMLMAGMAQASGTFSYRHSLVVEQGGKIAGLAHAHPAEWLREQDVTGLPVDRLAYLAPFRTMHVWDSYYVAALAVSRPWRRQGIATVLIDAVAEKAARGGFKTISLHVWADDPAARSFYQSAGFVVTEQADIDWHPDLPHSGGCLLMTRQISS